MVRIVLVNPAFSRSKIPPNASHAIEDCAFYGVSLSKARVLDRFVGGHFTVIDLRFGIEAKDCCRENRNRVTRIGSASRATVSAKAATDLVPHLFAEGFPARGSLGLGDIVPVEDVEVVEDRMAIAGHRQDAELFGHRLARTGDLPLAYRIGAGVRCETTELRHVRRRQ